MGHRILVVDDDSALRVLLNVLFTRAGFEVEFASDGREATERLALDGDGYKVIVLDLILPKISGVELLDGLQREKPALASRVIVLSGASRGVLEGIDTSRVHALIRKPFDIQELLLQAIRCSNA